MRTGFCISGSGRIVQAIIAAGEQGLLELDRPVFLTDKRASFFEYAQERSLDLILIERSRSESINDYKSQINLAVRALPVDALFLTFDWLLSPDTVSRFSPRILNLHMALLPLFPGKNAIAAALSSGMAVAGATIHQVDFGMDTGPILGQAVTPIVQSMNEQSLGREIFKAVLPLAVQSMRWLEQNRLVYSQGRRVFVDGAHYSLESSCSPDIDNDIRFFSSSYLKNNFP